MEAPDAARSAAKAEDAAVDLEQSAAMRGVARVGHAANGLVHLVIAGIAIGVAAGGGGSADQSGAMQAIASTPFGLVLLWIVAVALAGLAVFSVFEAVAARRTDGWGEVAKSLGKAIVYGAIAATALTFALGGSSDGDQAPESLSGQLLQQPFGPVLVGLVGAGVVAIGVAFVVQGIRTRFLKHIAPPARTRHFATALGAIGYVAKGVAVAVVGVLFIVAAVTNDPEQAGGLDAALRSLQSLPFGPWLLGAVGVGIAAYGVFCVARAGWPTKR